ncbi:hypothetical protein PCH_Pc21g04740 [Penicillium rubens Wisconsin 54-1255]|uniref:Uncharacterized protein n=1 Tax=Penicillium rubens (strain ATCC 28089 / DSM 1075 / NRRL 1951 / Wisconsin 54-1255) TaxID=500485 RepID=B6HMQ5_PENRW|nr:hypothetical protein PCH_Pc21g04740 [Penicillium rubens Wisconsin 54-1255]
MDRGAGSYVPKRESETLNIFAACDSEDPSVTGHGHVLLDDISFVGGELDNNIIICNGPRREWKWNLDETKCPQKKNLRTTESYLCKTSSKNWLKEHGVQLPQVNGDPRKVRSVSTEVSGWNMVLPGCDMLRAIRQDRSPI